MPGRGVVNAYPLLAYHGTRNAQSRRSPAAVLLQVVYHMHTDMNTLDMHLAPGIAFGPLPVRAPVRGDFERETTDAPGPGDDSSPYFEVRRDFD